MMRNAARIPKVLELVEELWREYPDWRLGQLIENVSAMEDPNQTSARELEDSRLVAQIKRHLRQKKKWHEAESAKRTKVTRTRKTTVAAS